MTLSCCKTCYSFTTYYCYYCCCCN